MRAIAVWFKDTPVGSPRQCADFVGQWREELLASIWTSGLFRAAPRRCAMARPARELWALHDLLQLLRALATGWHLGPDHGSAGRRSRWSYPHPTTCL